MKYTAGQAAKAVGKSVPTITRAIKNHTISAEKTPSGGYLIDPSELHRVFPPLTSVSNDTVAPLGHETPIDYGVLQAKVKMLEEMLAKTEENEDQWRQMAERLSKSLPAPAPSEVIRAGGLRSWWPWGRSNG